MHTLANRRFRGPGRILALLLVSAFLSASLTCAAMDSSSAASAHPCCPHSRQPVQERCTKMGCISTVPALLQESLTGTTEFPVAVQLDCNAVMEVSRPEWVAVPSFRPPEFELFLKHHQFLV
jgi:hypothetical protein